jgi:O-antigen biosynthesis protein WbqV
MLGFGDLRSEGAYKSALSSSINIGRLERILLDVAVSGLSFLFAIILRHGWSAFVDGRSLLLDVLVFSSVCAVVYRITGLSLRSWRFVSIPDVFMIMRDILIAIVTFMILSFLITRPTSLVYSVPMIACPIIITTLGGMRVFYRCLIERSLPFAFKEPLRADLSHTEPTSILAYGATTETDAFLRALQSEAVHSYQVVGIIDDDQTRCDWRIRGIKVLGGSADLPRIVKTFADSSIKPTRLTVSASNLPRQKLREIVDAAAGTGLRTVCLPNACDILERANETFAFESIEVTDLLGREPIALQLDTIDALIRGRSVVVTGGGGSIGSRLCRHLLRRGPAKLVIVDHSEFNLFQIERELEAIDRTGVAQPILASIRDRDRIQAIFEKSQVDLVFHAAAYKHVSLVESNPIEGILTNVVGTSNVADAAVAAGAAAMIMVSTDKAVKPSNTMGLSKRIAETYCQALDLDCAGRGQRTRCIVVRFGNVLGSSGSVVPIFEQQIRTGGPVTVTEPGMTRYFMTIEEAVELVLQGAALCVDRMTWVGAILVLDMGEPIRIVDLARRMISLAGYVPNRDIAIEFVGIRDGEKLNEQLFDDNEILERADMPRIRVASSKVRDIHRVRELCNRISATASLDDAKAITTMLREFLSNESLSPSTSSVEFQPVNQHPTRAFPSSSRVGGDNPGAGAPRP